MPYVGPSQPLAKGQRTRSQLGSAQLHYDNESSLFSWRRLSYGRSIPVPALLIGQSPAAFCRLWSSGPFTYFRSGTRVRGCRRNLLAYRVDYSGTGVRGPYDRPDLPLVHIATSRQTLPVN